MECTPSGTEHLLYCAQTLEDVCAQLLGAPEEAILSIRRRGILTPPAPAFRTAKKRSERDSIAESRMELLKKLAARREALEAAAGVLRQILREVEKAPKLEQRLLPRKS